MPGSAVSVAPKAGTPSETTVGVAVSVELCGLTGPYGALSQALSSKLSLFAVAWTVIDFPAWAAPTVKV